MVEKLKPCPFCGGDVYPVYSSMTKKYYMYHYERNENPCCIEKFELSGLRGLKCLKDAYVAWNNRTETKEEVAEMEGDS